MPATPPATPPLGSSAVVVKCRKRAPIAPPFRLTCFTVWDLDRDMAELASNFQYMCYAREVGGESGKEHFQAFAYNGQSQRTSWWNTVFNPPKYKDDPSKFIRWKKCDGTLLQNEAYCSKDGGAWIEFGTRLMMNGLHHGMVGIKRAIESGEPLRKIQRQDEHFEDCMRYSRALRQFQHDVRLDNMYDAGFKAKQVYIFIGDAGCHKSKAVRDAHPGERVYVMPDNTMAWAGSYDGENVVLFEDVAFGDVMKITQFLRYTDGYPVEAPVKGGYVPWTPTTVYFTSNFHPNEWWPLMTDVQRAAVDRRLTSIRVYKGVDDYE